MQVASSKQPYDSAFGEPRWDKEIGPLVEALRSFDWITTQGSCCGHGNEKAYVDFAISGGFMGLRRFICAANVVRDECDDIYFDLALNWSWDVVTSSDFRLAPKWLGLSLSIGLDDVPPSEEELSRLGSAFKKALRNKDWKKLEPGAAE